MLNIRAAYLCRADCITDSSSLRITCGIGVTVGVTVSVTVAIGITLCFAQNRQAGRDGGISRAARGSSNTYRQEIGGYSLSEK